MAVAAAFMVRQADFKRLLAYSSVEHMGILSLAVGLGGRACYGAMLHVINHSVTKGMLFLVAGNILARYQSKSTADIRGIARKLPISGALWVAGFLAITGSPPFGTFLSELVILKSALDQGRTAVAVAYLILLCTVFVGMGALMLRMAQGEPAGAPAALVETPDTGETTAHPRPRGRESWLAVLPPMMLGTVALILGIYIPPALRHLLEQAARAVGAH
jgi:hydrogenase-4 component F